MEKAAENVLSQFGVVTRLPKILGLLEYNGEDINAFFREFDEIMEQIRCEGNREVNTVSVLIVLKSHLKV